MSSEEGAGVPLHRNSSVRETRGRKTTKRETREQRGKHLESRSETLEETSGTTNVTVILFNVCYKNKQRELDLKLQDNSPVN